MSQRLLAERVGTSQAQVSGWEAGVRRLEVEQLSRLADVLRVPVLYLLSGSVGLGSIDGPPYRELRWYGLAVDGGARCPFWGVRPLETVIVEAVARPEPRVIEAVPGLLLRHRPPTPDRLLGEAAALGVSRRIHWLTDITLRLVSTGVGSLPPSWGQALPEADPDASWDGLGHPALDREGLPGVSKRWRIDYDADLSAFLAQAEGLIRSGAHDAR